MPAGLRGSSPRRRRCPGLDLADGAAYAPGGKDGGRAVAFGATDGERLHAAAGGVPRRARAARRGGARPHRGQARPRRAAGLPLRGAEAGRHRSPGDGLRVADVRGRRHRRVPRAAARTPPRSRRDCEAIANTLQVSAGKPFPVGPDPAFAETLGATFGKLAEPGREGPQGDRRSRRGDVPGARPRRRATSRRRTRPPPSSSRAPRSAPPTRRSTPRSSTRLNASAGGLEEGGRRGRQEGQARVRPLRRRRSSAGSKSWPRRSPGSRPPATRSPSSHAGNVKNTTEARSAGVRRFTPAAS